MLPNPDTVKNDIDRLTEEQLRQVADFIAFLRFRDRRHRQVLHEDQLASLASEFAEEDSRLAQLGMNEYAQMLHQEGQ
ncbi:MAG: hypothetical protein JJU32_07705 [Phormidium sp. BM_Day4_Bin.17]|nr:hypothetical protein [Phormidium sp. BM_Day4_Bin.17]UCJ11560.1 MAG: hypothetical protein JWS08_17670 [Phormidium sp. PBR-2020]